jgi:hypothetical protein
MICDASSNGRCPPQPPALTVGQVERNAQALMIRAEVVHRAHQIHPVEQGGHLPRQRPPAANQGCDPRPEGGVQPLDVGCVDHPPALRLLHQGIDLGLRALHYASRHADHTLLGILLDHLCDEDTILRSQTGTPSLPGDGFPEGLTNGINVCLTAIHTEQQGTTQRAVPHPLHQRAHQVLVTVLADLSTQPQAGLNLDRHRHPDDEALHFHPDLIGLYLPQVARPLHQVLVYLLAVLARPALPTQHCALIQGKRYDDGLDWTTMGQQCHDNDHDVLGRSQSVEGRPFGFSKRLAAYVALVAPLFETMYADVALADLSTCGTSLIGAEYSLWVHWHSPGLVSSQNQIVPKDPSLSTYIPTTV